MSDAARRSRHGRVVKSLCSILFVATAAVAGAQSTALSPKPTLTLQVGTQVIRAEIASTVEERTRGLMFRHKLAADAGMLFVFGGEQGGEICMWMKDTPIALSVAFIDGAGKVINIVDMQPYSEKMHCAARRAAYALEVNQGMFAAAGVKSGARIGGLPPTR